MGCCCTKPSWCSKRRVISSQEQLWESKTTEEGARYAKKYMYELMDPEEYIILTLYNKEHREGADIFPVSNIETLKQDEALEKLNEYKENPTLVFINGWTAKGRDEAIIYKLKQFIDLDNGNNNVINVNWRSLSGHKYAYFYNGLYAASVGKFLCDWFTKYCFDGKYLHLVGFSMGAHLAGTVGRFMSDKKRNNAPNRITGLDPAMLGYEMPPWIDNAITLGPRCAKFVDIIHTNAGFFGCMRPLGHVDFYVNGGTRQPTYESQNSYHSYSYKSLKSYHTYSVNIFLATIPYDKRELYPSYECSYYNGIFGGSYCVDSINTDNEGNNDPPDNYLGMKAHKPAGNNENITYLTETKYDPDLYDAYGEES